MSKNKMLLAGLGLTATGLAYLAAKKAEEKPLKTVEKVDLKRYAGKWYEIAAMPEPFKAGCACSTAEYKLKQEGYVEVTNRCLKDGREKAVEGKAFPVAGSNNSQLEVQFFWPLKGKYYIMALDEDYQYALVGHPNRRHLWVLSRYPEIDEEVYISYLQLARKEGFEINRLELSEQYGH